MEEDNPSEKNCYCRGITRSYIQMTLQTQKIYQCSSMRNVGILKQSLMMGSLLEILTKRRSQAFYKPIDVHSVRNAIGESISSTSIWNIGNQLGKYDYSYRSVVYILKERQHFSDQMNRNGLDLTLARNYCNCSTIENLRCLNSAANETIL